MRFLAPLKTLQFLLCLIPLGLLGQGWVADTLGANPIEALTRSLGSWTLNFLLLTLCITPLRQITGQAWLIRLRRQLGLFAFFYGTLHLISYLWLDQFFDWKDIGHDLLKRPFIAAGMVAFLLMLPLAITSTQGAIRQLGGKRWQALHRLIYLLTLLGVLHYAWLVKKDLALPAIYGCLTLLLLGYRAYQWLQKIARAPRRKTIPIRPL